MEAASGSRFPPKRIAMAALVGVAVAALPYFLRAGVSGADLSGSLGLSHGVGPGTFAVLYLAGLLTSLTPCVYPLIPITVGIFGARKAESRAKSIALSGTYVAGIAVTYSALGLFAALSGRAFGGALATPLVAALLACLLFALALSMFGAFELDLPYAVKQKLTSFGGAGFSPAFVMGLVAGVIAAPCTGPVLAGVLAFVATTRSAALGFWMLFTYALGLGTLFFVLGATTLKLPRSGAWMEVVKSGLGCILLAVGIGMILPHLPQPKPIDLSQTIFAAAGGVAAFAAVLFGALSLSFHGLTREKLIKGSMIALLLLGAGFRLGWLGAPKAPAIRWLHDEQAAIALAQQSGKPILVDFFAEWCAACKELDAHTFSDPNVQREVAEQFVPLKVDATRSTDEIDRLTDKYGVPGLPTVLMFGCGDKQKKLDAAAPSGAPPSPLPSPAPQPTACAVPQDGPGRLTGFEPPEQMLQRMDRALSRAQCGSDHC